VVLGIVGFLLTKTNQPLRDTAEAPPNA